MKISRNHRSYIIGDIEMTPPELNGKILFLMVGTKCRAL